MMKIYIRPSMICRPLAILPISKQTNRKIIIWLMMSISRCNRKMSCSKTLFLKVASKNIYKLTNLFLRHIWNGWKFKWVIKIECWEYFDNDSFWHNLIINIWIIPHLFILKIIIILLQYYYCFSLQYLSW